MSAALVTLEGLAAVVRQTSGLVTGLVDGVAHAARTGTAGYDALKARQLRSRLLDLHAEVTRFQMIMNSSVRRSLADYLREWAETARLHSRSDLLDPAARTAALERAFAANRSRGLPVPTQADHDARLDASWARLRKAMTEAGGAAAAILKDMQAERSEAILDASWAALMRGFHARVGIYEELAALPPPVTKAEIGRLTEVTEAYEALIRSLEAAATRLATLVREAG
ncbi:hypothetical protein DFH01_12540 [Falsiroseomonas bella]|uniref:Uncharacterized protein n=1 Tax=Falsiroseomonas bella TaxID=2184016 RepID=A0A317FI66_9PROT|nr:hypothetical protein [Falsiroseomonas bella]PWS37639.1 hypothetical protein DFH01_12540 [Falsiroseomonas bella]